MKNNGNEAINSSVSETEDDLGRTVNRDVDNDVDAAVARVKAALDGDDQSNDNSDINTDAGKRLRETIAKASQETTKATEDKPSNPVWLIPTFLILSIIGVVFVLVGWATKGAWPIPYIGLWNYAIGSLALVFGIHTLTMWE